MGRFRESKSFFWDGSRSIGKGKFGHVYKGMHKETAEAVAVKCFKNTSVPTFNDQQMKEFKILQGFDHPNIVQMFAIEDETDTEKKVLVMQLCAGGSLEIILEDPENHCGLQETEFLQVLQDVSAGLKYMRDNKWIHRDVKPGNMMKYIAADQTSIYKLIDFGSAKQVEETGTFESLHGTFEYLHPDLLAKVLNIPSEIPFHGEFHSRVDLWSIGVTLYQIATGHIPFQSYGGRENPLKMFKIISTKNDNVISGIQKTENDSISWRDELPESCHLSCDIREQLTLLLRGILQRDENVMWTYAKFFSEINNITSRKPIHVFYVNQMKELTLYMLPSHKLADMKGKLCMQLNVLPNDQLLFFNNAVFDPMAEVDTYPLTSRTQPIILLCNKMSDDKPVLSICIPEICFPKFNKTPTPIKDVSQAKCFYTVAYASKEGIQNLLRCRELLLESTFKVLQDITLGNVTELLGNLESNKRKLDNITNSIATLRKGLTMISMSLKSWPVQKLCDCEQGQVGAGMLEIHQKRNESHVYKLKQRVLVSSNTSDACGQSSSGMEMLGEKIGSQSAYHVANNSSSDEPRESIKQFSMEMIDKEHKKDEGAVNKLMVDSTKYKVDQEIRECPKLIGCVEQADTCVTTIWESWQLLKDMNFEKSTYNEKVHKLERLKIEQTSKKLFNLKDECFKSYQDMLRRLNEPLSNIQKVLADCELLKTHILSLTIKADLYVTEFSRAEAELEELSKETLSWLSMYSSSQSNTGSYGNSNMSIDGSLSHNGDSAMLDTLLEVFANVQERVRENEILTEELVNSK